MKTPGVGLGARGSDPRGASAKGTDMFDKRTAYAVTRSLSLNGACLAMCGVNLTWVLIALFVIGGLPLVLMAALGFHLWLQKLETEQG